jgi:hypothetical protein
MLYVLGVGTEVALTGSIITIIHDSFPNLKYRLVAAVTCVIGFVAGLVYVTPVSKQCSLACAVHYVQTLNT